MLLAIATSPRWSPLTSIFVEKLIVDIIYGHDTLPLDPYDLPFDHHNPRSLQDAPCRSLSNSHLVVYEVAGKGSVRAAS